MKYKHNILYTHLYSPSCNRKLDYKQLMKYYNLLFCVGQKIVKFSVISMLYFKTKNSSDCYLFLGLNLGLLLTTVSHLSNCRALIRLTAPIAKSNGLMSVCLSSAHCDSRLLRAVCWCCWSGTGERVEADVFLLFL